MLLRNIKVLLRPSRRTCTHSCHQQLPPLPRCCPAPAPPYRTNRQVELTTAFDETPAAQPEAQAADEAPAAAAVAGRPSSSTAAGAPTSSSRPGRRQGPKSRRQRQVDMASAADAAAAGGAVTTAAAAAADEQRSCGPKRCKEAIDAGLEAFTAQRYGEAIELFNLALELPGNGAYRLSGSPREYACPSDAEERAALYNLACCYAQLGQREAALTCLDSVLESGAQAQFERAACVIKLSACTTPSHQHSCCVLWWLPLSLHLAGRQAPTPPQPTFPPLSHSHPQLLILCCCCCCCPCQQALMTSRR